MAITGTITATRIQEIPPLETYLKEETMSRFIQDVDRRYANLNQMIAYHFHTLGSLTLDYHPWESFGLGTWYIRHENGKVDRDHLRGIITTAYYNYFEAVMDPANWLTILPTEVNRSNYGPPFLYEDLPDKGNVRWFQQLLARSGYSLREIDSHPAPGEVRSDIIQYVDTDLLDYMVKRCKITPGELFALLGEEFFQQYTGQDLTQLPFYKTREAWQQEVKSYASTYLEYPERAEVLLERAKTNCFTYGNLIDKALTVGLLLGYDKKST